MRSTVLDVIRLISKSYSAKNEFKYLASQTRKKCRAEGNLGIDWMVVVCYAVISCEPKNFREEMSLQEGEEVS